jgi:hypothetical protein
MLSLDLLPTTRPPHQRHNQNNHHAPPAAHACFGGDRMHTDEAPAPRLKSSSRRGARARANAAAAPEGGEFAVSVYVVQQLRERDLQHATQGTAHSGRREAGLGPAAAAVCCPHLARAARLVRGPGWSAAHEQAGDGVKGRVDHLEVSREGVESRAVRSRAVAAAATLTPAHGPEFCRTRSMCDGIAADERENVP